MFGKKFIEGLEVAGFLIVHVFHQWAEVRVSFDNGRRLGRVDQGSCKLPGLVDTQGTVEEVSLLFGEDGSVVVGIFGG